MGHAWLSNVVGRNSSLGVPACPASALHDEASPQSEIKSFNIDIWPALWANSHREDIRWADKWACYPGATYVHDN